MIFHNLLGKNRWRCNLFLLVLVAAMIASSVEARRSGRRSGGGSCGLTCYRWRKCKSILNTLTSGDGSARPGERGNTGQLIFDKCEDPPENCDCEEELKPKEPPKPRIPRKMLDFVDADAELWLANLVDIE